MQTDGSGNVSTWLDQSGNGNNATQTNSGYRPALTTNALNTLPAVSFINNGNYLDLPNLMNGAAAGEIFIVVQAASATPSNNPGLYQFGSGTGGCYPNSSGLITDNFGSSTTYTVGIPPSGVTQYSLYNVSSQSGQWTARLDGITLLNSTTNSVVFNAAPHLGHNSNTGFNGSVAEVIVYNSVLSAGDRAAVGQYLVSKYNLPGIALPSNPTGLIATPISPSEVSLVWSDAPTTTGITYTVWRQTGSGGYSAVAQLNNTLSFVDSGLTAGTTYNYEISSSTLAGSSPGFSSVASASTLASGTDMPLSGMALWLSADSGVQAASNGSITQWVDQSGNGNNATQTTFSYLPTLTASALNGRPVVTFGGTNYFNLPNLMSGATSGEIFIVVQASSATPSNNLGLYQFGNGAGGSYPNSSGLITDNFGSSTTYTVGIPPSGVTQYSLYNVSSQSGQWTARLDGITLLNSTTNSVVFNGTPHLGHNSNNAFNGTVAEVIVYNSVLSAAARATVGQYLVSKYSLPGIAIPSNPTGLAATPISPTEVSLIWSDAPTTTGITYTVWRQTGSGAYSAVAQLNNSLSFIDSGLTAGTTYNYEISSSTLAGSSPGFSSVASATTMASGTDMPLSGMALWLSADSGVQAASNGSITQWVDQSGNGNNATQNTISYLPTLTASALNGRPVVTFGGTNYFNLPNLMSGATAGEIFIVVKAASATPSSSLGMMQFGSGTGGCYPTSSGYVTENFGSTTTYSIPAPASGVAQYSIYDVSSQPGQFTASLDGVTLLNSTNNTVAFNVTPHLGHNSNTAFNGAVAEVIIYNNVLSAAQRVAVGQYLYLKYNPPSLSVPSNPTGLTATPLSPTEISLVWSDVPSTTGITYSIWRQTGSGSYAVVAQVNNALSFIDSGLAPGTTYSYEISSSTLAGSSPGFSAAVGAATFSNGTDMPLTGMRLWLKADAGVEANSSGSVGTWLDQSGNSNNAAQIVPGGQPLLAPSALNGRPAVKFVNGGQNLSLPNLMSGATAGEVFVVVKANSPMPTTGRGLLCFGSGTAAYYPNTAGEIVESFGSTTTYDVGLPPFTLASYALYNVSSQAGQWTARLDGVTLLSSTSNSVAFNTVPYIGSNGSVGFDGEVAEVIVYNSVLREAQRASVYNYLGNKYLPFILIANFDFGLEAEPISMSQVNLSWISCVSAASYTIQRSVDGGIWVQLATVSAPATTYSDTSVPAGNVIKYRIQGVDFTGVTSAFSEPALAFVNPTGIDPSDGFTYATDQMLGIDPTLGSDSYPPVPISPTPTPTPTENPSVTTPPTVTLTTPSQATLH